MFSTAIRIALAASLLCSPALAQDDARTGDSATPADVLRGPSVDDRNLPGDRTRFGEPMETPRPGAMARPVPFRLFLAALRTLESSPELTLAPEQSAAIRTIVEELQAEQRSFRREHGAELRELRWAAQLGDQRRRGQGNAPRDAVSEEAQSARERLRELQRMAPGGGTHQARVWAVLDEPQQEHVRAEIARRQAEGDRDRLRERYGDAPAPSAGSDDLRWEQLRARIDALPPERRERVLDLLSRVLDRAEGASPPPPAMDSVDVPPAPARDAPRGR